VISSPTYLNRSQKGNKEYYCEELAAASADMDPEQPPVLLTPSPSPQ